VAYIVSDKRRGLAGGLTAATLLVVFMSAGVAAAANDSVANAAPYPVASNAASDFAAEGHGSSAQLDPDEDHHHGGWGFSGWWFFMPMFVVFWGGVIALVV